MPQPMSVTLRAGVDVGGTFTDVVVFDIEAKTLRSAKVSTNYDDPVASIIAGLDLVDGSNVDVLHHATTLSTNAIIENRLPKGALLTTHGFRDVLEIARIQRPEEGIYDFNVDTPAPLIARELRLEVIERIGAKGEIVTPLDEDALEETFKLIQSKENVTTIAVCGLFSFVNDIHERRIGELIDAYLPDVYVSLSCDIAPEIREFERTSTVVLDALLKPVVAPYLSRLDTTLASRGIDTTRIMMASGGLTSCREAASAPVTTINSGPSAGVLAAANLGRQLQEPNLITIDMGGTSLDIGVVEDGRSVLKFDGSIAGYPLRIPAIDVAAVAAGGGSLALLDELGFVQVDRESAGSTPGPACYGRGGTRPTITDADVILGRLGRDLGGRGGFVLDEMAARAAIEENISRPLGIDINEAAQSVLDIIQARMSKAITSNTLEKGLDLRHLPLVAYGGAGPTHAVELALGLGIDRVIVPYFAGNFSAIGLLLCPLKRDESAMVLKLVDAVNEYDLTTLINQLDQQARKTLVDADAELTTTASVHLRYAGQSYDMAVAFESTWSGSLARADIDALVERFHILHERRYAYRGEHEQVEMVQVRVTVASPELDFPAAAPDPDPDNTTPRNARQVYFTSDRQWHTASVYDRASISAQQMIDGPAVVEGEGSATLIPPGWSATCDRFLNLDIRKIA